MSQQTSNKPTVKLNFKALKIKEKVTNWYVKATESKWTCFFIITSIVQSIIAIVMEIIIVERNENASWEFQVQAQNDTCISYSVDRINNIYGENIIFILFNIFQVWFCFNAIVNQNTIQIITIAVINYLIGIFGIIQIVEIEKWKKTAIENCNLSSFDSYDLQIVSHELPLIILSLLCATLMGFLTWKLYQAFGWNIYKKIGADPKMQGIYRTMLIFVMLLKLDLFFMIVMSIEVCTVFKVNEQGARNLSAPLYVIHAVVTGSLFLLQTLAYRSLNKESHLGTKIFIGMLPLVIADFIMLLVKSTTASKQDSWYFLIIYIISGIIMAILTFIWAIFLLKNFDKGLKKHLCQMNLDVSPYDATSETHSTGTRPGSPIRWAIDDDD
ncbi:12654_t:CDS:10 [Acaulospora morrowiae]|uniref:12654_t:CDS:1 n=1 Tax=Acaulospora morrowiae TaxID=94023 RepID=A0A9N8VGB8_9GLOM|nr:12654_t:CDS:10 [Acaulospora morrowiae]